MKEKDIKHFLCTGLRKVMKLWIFKYFSLLQVLNAGIARTRPARTQRSVCRTPHPATSASVLKVALGRTAQRSLIIGVPAAIAREVSSATEFCLVIS